MKSIQLLSLLLPAALFGQLASGIAVHNTRDINNPPSDFGHQVQADFKIRGVVGAPGEGYYSGMLTIAPWSDNSGDKHHQLNFNNGGIFYRMGLPQGQWEGWKKLVIADSNGNVGIATTSPDTTLDVGGIIRSSISSNEGGTIDLLNPSKTGASASVWRIYNMTGGYGNSLQFWSYSADGSASGAKFILGDNGNISTYGKFEAREIKVTNTPTADFVFEENYNLPTLESVEKHIKDKKHLPEIASATAMQKEGVNIGEFQIKLLQKIEELTLYTIEQNKLIKQQQKNMEKMQDEINALKKTN
ncbi:cell wall anchor protein [Chryseobacterium sp. c4a]|uniref:cell wall anchor protein n=1 Tax=Chryseobacterium sp. c4a TaxID=1573582 RepID=UPI001629D863|nr:cell wall anchor protein [Chryseobacterium sp. c4a]